MQNLLMYNDSLNRSMQSRQEHSSRNLLIEMEKLFECEGTDRQPLFKSVTQIQNKLHQEIQQFQSGVHDIMREMQPVKKQIIEKISQLIQNSVPNGDVQIYGSHATQLCLHWSDIDLVLIPPECKHMVPAETADYSDNTFQGSQGTHANDAGVGKNSLGVHNSTPLMYTQSKNWLATVF